MLRYRGLLYSVCRRYSRDGLTVDDLLQETLIALWNLREKMISITPPPKQAAWIWRVARSTCIDLRRHSPPPCPLPEGYEIATENLTLHDTLHELIAQLPEPDRSIVTLHLEGYDYQEIGQKLRISKSNVGVRLMRAKEKLKKAMNN